MVLCSTWTLWLTENMDECTAGHYRGAAETIIRSLNALFVWTLKFELVWSFYNVIFVENRHLLTTFSVFISLIWHLTCGRMQRILLHCYTITRGSQSRSSLPPILQWLTSKGQFVAVWSQFCIFSFLKLKHWSLFIGKNNKYGHDSVTITILIILLKFVIDKQHNKHFPLNYGKNIIWNSFGHWSCVLIISDTVTTLVIDSALL